MAIMTKDEASRLDELYTKTTPRVDIDRLGVFAAQNGMVDVLDGFVARYLESKGAATKRSPSENVSKMVRNELEAAVRAITAISTRRV
jgi:hypothetical protein